jgi:hypothetical protein
MKIIAYYLPQFHPIPENDKWWGKGFTEWTNVGKARKYYRDHYQPKVHRDLGYYDLRNPETREAQADLAREAGVDGFCYWHYWFGAGKRLLERPFKEVLSSGSPDFPFCLGWANESWMAKVWDYNSTKRDKVLIEQTYPGNKDICDHFYELLDAFKDKRYIRYKNKPIFVIYRPFLLPNSKRFIKVWNLLAKREGFCDGIHFIGHTEKSIDLEKILDLGFDAVNVVRNGEYAYNSKLIKKIIWPTIKYKLFRQPLKVDYSLMIKYFIQEHDVNPKVYPTIIPNWDHTPRSGIRGSIFHNSTPALFEKHLFDVFEVIKNKSYDDKIVFLKSWNEWAEGNYMEPDLKHGKKYIEVLGGLRKYYEKITSI